MLELQASSKPQPAAATSSPSTSQPSRRSADQCAVSLGFLRRFLAAHVLSRPDGTQLSTLDVVIKVIKPLTQPHSCRLVDMPVIDPPGLLVPDRGDVGPPDYFISHAWYTAVCFRLFNVQGHINRETLCI